VTGVGVVAPRADVLLAAERAEEGHGACGRLHPTILHASVGVGHRTGMTSLTRVTASLALAAAALLSAGCNGNQSGDSVTDNQDRVSPPTASPSS
jgi:hypothetical protein